MGVCIDKLPHHCGTRKGLQVFANEETGKVDGWCFSCNKFVANPYGVEKTINEVDLPEPKTEEEIQLELAEVSGYDVVDVPSRKLRAEDLKPFGVKVAVSEEDGKTPTHMYFPMKKQGKITGYYVKTVSKPSHMWSIGDVKDCDLFNWDRAKDTGAYKLIITEGLEDAISVEKIFKRYGKEEYQPAVVSLTNGTNSVKRNLTKHKKELANSFKEVIFNFDNDEPGKKALEQAMIILPSALSVTLPRKDANDCILEGVQRMAFKAFSFDTYKPKNSRLIFAEDLFEKARTPTPWGELSWPYPSFEKAMRGIRLGTTIYIGAGVSQSYLMI